MADLTQAGNQMLRIAQVLDGAYDDVALQLRMTGTSKVVSKTVTFTGAANNGAVGTIPLFTVTGAVLATVVALCTTTLAGATATQSVGPAGAPTGLIPSVVATTITAGLPVDSTGLLAILGAANITPTKILFNSQNIIATVGVANITAGVLQYLCFYRPLSSDAVVV